MTIYDLRDSMKDHFPEFKLIEGSSGRFPGGVEIVIPGFWITHILEIGINQPREHFIRSEGEEKEE